MIPKFVKEYEEQLEKEKKERAYKILDKYVSDKCREFAEFVKENMDVADSGREFADFYYQGITFSVSPIYNKTSFGTLFKVRKGYSLVVETDDCRKAAIKLFNAVESKVKL